MSQRRDALRVIERDSGCESILVRPLCAKNLDPTQAELDGLIDREQLLAFSGRNRTPQMKLAEQFGITDYPSPAGGCILADPILSERVQEYYRQNKDIVPEDILLLLVGRQFKLPSGGWLVVGRDEQQNEKIKKLQQPDDWLLQPSVIPGPTAILRYSRDKEEIKTAAAIVTRYTKKSTLVEETALIIAERKTTSLELQTPALDDSICKAWLKK
jgi:hypothetical protein